MSKLLLPIDHNPVFISRYESAVPFSVIQAQQISIEPLIAISRDGANRIFKRFYCLH